MKEKIIKVLMVEPKKEPMEVYMKNDIYCFGDFIREDEDCEDVTELFLIEDNVGIVRNRHGAIYDYVGNRKIGNEIIAGTFFVVGVDSQGIMTSLTYEQIEKYSKLFWDAEIYTDKEVRASYWANFEEEINLMEIELS